MCFFFFKQKTAYEMRISDWSSDVCSSDLMLRIGATQRYVDPLAAGINDLQEMSKTHEAISKAKTQTWYRILTHYLPLYFPEIERFAGNSRSDWFLAMIERFPTRSEEHTSELQSLMRLSYAVFCLKK